MVNNATGQQENLKIDDPITLMRSLVSRKVRTNLKYRFIGGAVGYISYDAIRYWEKLPSRIQDLNKFPDIELAIYDDGLIVDHNLGSVYYYYSGRDRSKQIIESIKKNVGSPNLDHGEVICDTERSVFEKKRRRIKGAHCTRGYFSSSAFKAILLFSQGVNITILSQAKTSQSITLHVLSKDGEEGDNRIQS